MHTPHWGGPGEDYRLKKISSVNIDVVSGISGPAPDDAAPVWQTPKARHSFPWFEVIMTTVGTLGLLGMVIFWLSPESSGVASLVKTTLLAVVPLLIVLSFILFIDRWEPEPWKTKVALFLWGAGVATLSSGILNTALEENITFTTGDLQQSNALAAAFIAPLVEETLKGLGVLIVVVVRRTNINSLIDGVVYAGFSACGFMFAEDILYFIRVDNPEAGGVLLTFVLRGLFSPFVHAMATSMTGIGLALALLKFKRGWSKTGIVLVFWFFAMFIHFAWNGTSTFLFRYFFLLYAVIGVPAFIVWAVALIIMSRNPERQALAKAFGATHIVEERGEEGIAKVMELTDGVGAHGVAEAVGTQQSFDQALGCVRHGGYIGFVGVPHDSSIGTDKLFGKQVHLEGGPAPVRKYLPTLIDLIYKGEIEPGRVFDLVLPIDEAAKGYEAMDQRTATKVLLTMP